VDQEQALLLLNKQYLLNKKKQGSSVPVSEEKMKQYLVNCGVSAENSFLLSGDKLKRSVMMRKM
jgi:hypothetical protein